MLTPHTTLDALGKKLLDSKIVQALDEVDVYESNTAPHSETPTGAISPNTTGDAVLPEIDLEVKKLEMGLELKEFSTTFSATGITMTIFILALSTLIINVVLTLWF